MRTIVIALGLSFIIYPILWSQDPCSENNTLKESLSDYKVYEYNASHYSISVYLGESSLLFLDYREMAVGIAFASYTMNPDSTITIKPNPKESRKYISLHNEILEARPKLFLVDLSEYNSWRIIEGNIELKGYKTFSCILKQQ